MTWQIYLVIIIISNVAWVILTKSISNKIDQKAGGIFYQFFFCLILAGVCAQGGSEFILTKSIFLVLISGVLNSIASFCFWKAVDVNLSKTSLFFPLSDVIPVIFAFHLFGEGNGLRSWQIIGVILCFITIWSFRPNNKSANPTNQSWFYCLITIILIFSANTLLLKYYSSSIGTGPLLVSWYAGSLAGTILILVIKKENLFRISLKKILLISPLSLAMFASLFCFYQALKLGGPLSLIQPVRRAATTFIPIFIGWFFFHERERFTRWEGKAFLVGLVGIVLIMIK